MASQTFPFFTYYGGKWRVAPRYPEPYHGLVIEPFAGSAGYSVRHESPRAWLNDPDPHVCGTWDYLIRLAQLGERGQREILNLPDIEATTSVDDYAIPQEARWLIGWWLNKGSATPKRRPSSFALKHPAGAPYWGASIRERIARQLPLLRQWQVTSFDYRDLPDGRGTWFIDPPYVGAGHHYRLGSSTIDYADLAQWCRSRTGQVIVCEADDADWLPFEPLAPIQGNKGRQRKGGAAREVVYLRG